MTDAKASAAVLVGGSIMRGVGLMLLGISIFVMMSSFVKAAGRVPAGEAMFFRAAGALPVVLIWLLLRGDLPGGVATRNVRSHAVRGIAGSMAMALGFAGLHYLPLPEVTAIRFVTPVLIVVLAALLLGERLRLVRISAVMVGLLGVTIIIWPRLSSGSASGEALGVALILASSMLAALAQVFVKSMSGKEKTAAIVFWFQLTAALLALVSLPFGWVLPRGVEWVWLIGAGITGGLGQIFVTASYRYADAGVLAPFSYVSMLWSLLVGYLWFDEVATVPMLIGATLVIGAGVMIVLRERQLGLRATAEAKLRAKGLQ